MRWLHRVAIVLGVLAPSVTVVVLSCDTGARGIEACQAIYSEMCQLAPACGDLPASKVEWCEIYYRDFCLVGLENNEAGRPDPAPCVSALNALVACKDNAPGTACPGAPLVDASWVATGRCGALDAAPPYTACQIAESCPERLSACSFVSFPPASGDASTSSTSDASSSGGTDAGQRGDAVSPDSGSGNSGAADAGPGDAGSSDAG